MEKEYPWQHVYLRAVLETDNAKLPQWIAEARLVINVRLRELNPEESVEERAIVAAIEGLRTLENERLRSGGVE